MMDEDAEHTLLYVDMLGASDLTEKFPTRLIHSVSDETGFNSTKSSETPNQFNRFSRVLRECVDECSLHGSVTAMLFSDSAFLEFGNSLRATMAATELMRNFILAKVPVRMGLGSGTFYPLRFSLDITDPTIVSRSSFIGTAVVRAHHAEQCGGKGLRIFVHPLVRAELTSIQQRINVMALVKPYKHATWELDFLHERMPVQEKQSAEEADRGLFRAVLEMKAKCATAPMAVRRHYIETIKAMNRMREKNSRPPISRR
jgi:hypothetical protein